MQTAAPHDVRALDAVVAPVSFARRPRPKLEEAERQLRELQNKLEILRSAGAAHGDLRRAETRVRGAMAAAGAPDGEYWVGGQLRIVKDRVARLSNGHLAGSVATMDRCVRTMVLDVGVSLLDAVKMASLNPARAMGFADRLGTLRAGHDASLTVIDDDVNVYMTMVKGQIRYASF
jgi:hypothetical protein